MNLLPPYSTKVWKIIGYAVLGLIVLGLVLFTMDRCSSGRDDKKVREHFANINALTANIQKMESGVIPATKEEIAAEKMAANVETKALVEAVGGTEEAKAETNAALANLANAKNANTTNSSVADLEKALEKLK